MISFDYLPQGINGMANAHHAGTMAGHLGAAVLAGYFFGEDQNELPDAVYQGVSQELDRVIAGEEAIWFNAKQKGLTPTELFRKLPAEEPQPEQIPSIAKALESNVGQTRQSGHNIIFASIAIRAFHDHPDLATPSAINGTRKLITGFDNAHAGRGYYGREKGWLIGNQVKLPEPSEVPAYRTIPDMVNATITELIETASIRRQGFGGLWHLINHAAAITELDRFGYKALALKALPAHHHHLRLLRSLPDLKQELGIVVKADYDPRKPAFWDGMLKRDEARLTHRIKTLYGFYTLRRHIESDTTRQEAEDALLYLMA
ncbi:hypothetical protein AB1L30_11765 [Bremerella sp. JC817]|uniref:hypothetical protein n=1 Tax=Bremerella sp. JC817 TaxID=3231756 RepID=UPI00345855E5